MAVALEFRHRLLDARAAGLVYTTLLSLVPFLAVMFSVLKAFGVLQHFRFLRGTALDIFGRTEERRMERQLIEDYMRTIDGLLGKLDRGNVDLAVQIASIPEHIRGYGHVKEAHLHEAKAREAALLREWDNPLRLVQVA